MNIQQALAFEIKHKLKDYLVPVDEDQMIMFNDRPAVAEAFEFSRYLYWDKVRPDERN